MRWSLAQGFSRRSFLRGAAGGTGSLILGVKYSPAEGAIKKHPSSVINNFIRVDPDNTTTLLINYAEFGNGAYTSLAMMVAEEMDIDWNTIVLEEAPTEPKYYSPLFKEYLTAGSVTTLSAWMPMRTAGAQARDLFLRAAALKWDTDIKALDTQLGNVIERNGDRSSTYGDLLVTIEKESLTALSNVSLKTPKSFKLIGTNTKRIEGTEKVNGSAIYGIDIKLPGMLYGSVARCPVYGGKALSWNDSKTMAVKGVVKTKRISSGIVVLAKDFWSAKKGRDALEVVWDEGQNASLSSEKFYSEYKALASKPGMLAEDIGNSLKVLHETRDTIEAVYEMPYLAHACMEPMNCTAMVEQDNADTDKISKCEIWSGTQYQSNDQEIVSKLLNIPQQSVTVHRPLIGGSFGRRASKTADFTVDAVEAANGENVPVQVIWSREEDIRGAHYRPLFVHKLRGALDDKGMPLAWHQTVVGQSIMQGTKHDPAYMVRGMDIYSLDGCLQEPFGVFRYGTSYAIPNHRVESHNPPKVGVNPHEWRAVGHTHTGIAYECFLDEMAHAGGKDPLDLRLELTKDNPRMNKVLKLLEEKTDWNTSLGEGRARGMAARIYSVSPCAQAVEITLLDNGEFSIDKVVCVIDCGIAVNPLGIESQVQGGISIGISAVAFGNIEIVDGRIKQSNFHDYNVMRINHMPEIEVHIIPSEEMPTGVGEQATAPIAPAVANAIFAASGTRVRSFPLSKHGFKLI